MIFQNYKKVLFLAIKLYVSNLFLKWEELVNIKLLLYKLSFYNISISIK